METYQRRTTENHQPVRNAEYLMAIQLEAAQETLAKSPLYFTLENLAQMEATPDLQAALDRTVMAVRSAICHSEFDASYETRQVALTDGLGDIQALSGATRVAGQLLRILGNHARPSSLAPLRRITDAVIRQLQATASALHHQDAGMACTAARAFTETRGIVRNVMELLPALVMTLPETTARMIRAGVVALVVIARAAERIAYRFAGALTFVQKARRAYVPPPWADLDLIELLPLPTIDE